MRDWLSDFEAMTAEVASLRAENAKLKEASADLLRDWQAERAEAENLRDRVAALEAERDRLAGECAGHVEQLRSAAGRGFADQLGPVSARTRAMLAAAARAETYRGATKRKERRNARLAE
jgi:cell division protein FtsB